MKRSMLTAACVIASIPFIGHADDVGSPIFGVKVPSGYRQWEVVGPSHVP